MLLLSYIICGRRLQRVDMREPRQCFTIVAVNDVTDRLYACLLSAWLLLQKNRNKRRIFWVILIRLGRDDKYN